MKTLYIVRHAKSSWEFHELPDHERPLLEKGKKRTKRIIDFLLDEKVQVDFIISSSAVRAVETARFLARALKYPIDEIRVDTGLYHADSEKIFDQFLDLSENYSSLMIVGHNPALTNFSNHFLKEPIDWLPTSGIVAIDIDSERWERIRSSKYKLRFVAFPKQLKRDSRKK